MLESKTPKKQERYIEEYNPLEFGVSNSPIETEQEHPIIPAKNANTEEAPAETPRDGYEYYDEEVEEEKADYDFRDFIDDRPLTAGQQKALDKIDSDTDFLID